MIELVAHRGYQRNFPENTLLAHREAILAGARYVETDVQLSADGVPVLYHDDDMLRMSEVTGSIHEYPFAELCTLPAAEPHRFGDRFAAVRITPLADLVRLLVANPAVHAFIEIKILAIEKHGIETVYRNTAETLGPAQNQCTLISYSVPFMSYAAQCGWPGNGVVLEYWEQRHDPEITALRPAYLFCSVQTLPPMGDLTCETARSVIFEIDDPGKARALVARGIDLIETFDVGGMQAALSGDR